MLVKVKLRLTFVNNHRKAIKEPNLIQADNHFFLPAYSFKNNAKFTLAEMLTKTKQLVNKNSIKSSIKFLQSYILEFIYIYIYIYYIYMVYIFIIYITTQIDIDLVICHLVCKLLIKLNFN